MSNPLECPITLSLMENPVIAPDGYTYEQRAITTWLLKHGTSPQTRQTMSVNDLIPNRAIADLLARENNNGVNANIRSLLAQLLNIDTTVQQEDDDELSSTSLLLLELMKNAACTLGMLNQNSIETYAELITSAGAIVPLIEQTKSCTGLQKQKAVRALHGLARNNDVAKQTIGREGGIPPLVEILKNGSLLQKLTAVSSLVTLARNNTDNRILIAAETIGIDQLAEPSQDSTTHKQKEITACALLQWTAHEDNTSTITTKNGPLMWIAKHSTPAQKDKAMAALATWAVEHEDSRCPKR